VIGGNIRDALRGDFTRLEQFFVTAILVAAVPCFAQQVRLITGDIEHVYGPDGQFLDDAKLRAKNRRAERLIREQRRSWSANAAVVGRAELVVPR
jgi:hypothetical protein